MHLFVLQSLKETMYRVVPEKQKEVAEFRKEYGDKSLGEYTVDQVYFTHIAYCVTISTIASHFLCDFCHVVTFKVLDFSGRIFLFSDQLSPLGIASFFPLLFDCPCVPVT